LFLNSNSILKKEQFTLRKGISTDKASYIIIDELLCALNDKIHVVDLAKAFDCVSHDILLLKLTFYRIQGKAGTVVSIILTMTTLKIPFLSLLA
jgi:hypothetical protein